MHHSAELDELLSTPVDARADMPITWYTSVDGEREVLSRYGDDRYDFRPYLTNPATHNVEIDLTVVPQAWRETFRELIVAYWRFGRGFGSPKASTVLVAAFAMVPYLRWLAMHGVTSFSEVLPIHAREYAEYLRDTPRSTSKGKGQARSARGIEGAVACVSLPWDLRNHLSDPPIVPPWGDRGGLSTACSIRKSGPKISLTRCLDEDEVRALFQQCERILAGAEQHVIAWEQMYDRRERLAIKRVPKGPTRTHDPAGHQENRWLKREFGFSCRQLSSEIHLVRGAIGILIGLLVGMRVSEILSLERGCYSTRDEFGEALGYLRGRSFKSNQEGLEEAEWLAPPIVADLIHTLERIAVPMCTEQRSRIEDMKRSAATARDPEKRKKLALKYLQATQSQSALFVGGVGNQGEIRITSRSALGRMIDIISAKAQLTSTVTPHVLRRTFAVSVVHSCNGDLRYLRKHFQHWSIETTALYASNESREQGLVDEIAEQMLSSKVELVFRWLDPELPLAGKAGAHLAATRSKPEFRAATLNQRRELAGSLAEGFDVRDTGHSYCIYKGVPTCGGRGIYDARECAGCSGALVTPSEAKIWIRLAEAMIEVERRGDAGEVGMQIVTRSLAAYDAVLQPLGYSIQAIREAQRKV